MLNVVAEWEGLDEEFARVEAECADIFRGLSVRIWNGILSKTPQFQGRMAASWSYTIGAPEYVDRSSQVDPEGEKLAAHRFTDLGSFRGLYRGHPLAIAVANAASAGRDGAFKLGDTVWIANGVDHGEGPYSGDIEAGNIHLRTENLPGVPVGRTLDWVKATYGDGISKNRAQALKTLHIGDSDAISNS